MQIFHGDNKRNVNDVHAGERFSVEVIIRLQRNKKGEITASIN